MQRLISLLALGLCATVLSAQMTVSGNVTNAATEAPIPGVIVKETSSQATVVTDAAGHFELTLPATKKFIVFVFFKDEWDASLERSFDLDPQHPDLGTIALAVSSTLQEGAAITLNELNAAGAGEDATETDVYSPLSAGRDLFLNAVRFGVGGRRFRIRGMDSENRLDYLNGMPINKMHDGRTDFYDFGGLNDVLRRQENSFGLAPGHFSFGGALGSWQVDTRASSQRRQKRISYAVSNRSYRQRVMAVYATGMMENGLALAVSASRRWGKQGYIPGTYYENTSYFLSVDKKWRKHHLFNLTILGSPGIRGRSGVTLEEPRQILQNNYYNPKWGYQQGKVRNAEVDNNHQPIVILRYDWNPGPNTHLTASLGRQFGRSGRTRLNWQKANDPRPDYYRNLPSAYTDSLLRDKLTAYYKDHPEALQIDWDHLYQVNYGSYATIHDANGISANSVTGKMARYFLEESRIDNNEWSLNTTLEHAFASYLAGYLGLTYRTADIHYFKTVDDLLGADFVYDIDKYNISYSHSDSYQPDLNIPNKVAAEGDIIGYDYVAKLQNASAWTQIKAEGRRLTGFVALSLAQKTMQRVGNMRNGHFPDNSYGPGEKKSFLNYGIKSGLTFKINGRNYLFANAYQATRAPFFRDAYLSPRTREQFVPDLANEKLLAVEAGYLLNAPGIKARLRAYYYTRQNRTRTITFFSDLSSIDFKFGSLALTGLDTRNVGTELAVEAKLTPAWTASAVASVGQHLITSRPHATFTVDDSGEEIDVGTVYWKNYRVANTPMRVYSVRVSYRSPKFWFANLTAGMADDLWLDINPLRKTATAVDPFGGHDDPRRQAYLKQEKLPASFTLDFFGGKSFKFGRHFLYLNLGISNLLDDQNIRTGGFEQLRLDPDRFPNKYFYAYGRTYFASAAWRF